MSEHVGRTLWTKNNASWVVRDRLLKGVYYGVWSSLGLFTFDSICGAMQCMYVPGWRLARVSATALKQERY